MKILLINTSERTGGAAVAANRLMNALCKSGMVVNMLVRDKSSDDNRVVSVNSSAKKRLANRLRFYFERLLIFLANRYDRKYLFRVSTASTGTDISRHPLVQEADIIHLHWVNQGFLSLSDLQKLFRLGKPVVWTMHDMWPFTGICHYARGCKAYQWKCGACFYLHDTRPKDGSTRIFRKKMELYCPAPLTFVGCSRWITDCALQSVLLKGKEVLPIPNPLDTSLFRPRPVAECRRAFHLPEDKHLILFGALNVTDERKGVNYLVRALEILSDKNIELVVFGQARREIKDLVPVTVHAQGYLTDENRIAMLYGAVDLFVTSSLDDNLPNTIMEAMACGTPCVGFETGGIPEMIDHLKNGYVAQSRDVADLAQGIRWVLDYPDKEALSSACLKKVKANYAEEVVAGKYIALYRRLLREREA